MATSYGYARVSSADQNETRQILALIDAGIDRSRIFVDHRSGKDFNRPAWRRLRRSLRRGDTLVVLSLDRLGRNYSEMLDEWRILVRSKEVNIKVLDMPILDTTNKSCGLIGKVIAEIVLQLLSFVAENERRNIRERQQQGIAAAKARGVQFGRPKRELPPQFATIMQRVIRGEMTKTEAAMRCNMAESTFRSKLQRHQIALRQTCRGGPEAEESPLPKENAVRFAGQNQGSKPRQPQMNAFSCPSERVLLGKRTRSLSQTNAFS